MNAIHHGLAPAMMSIESRMLEKRYYDYPDSLDPLTRVFRIGLIPVALCAMLSLVSVTALLVFITYRLISWRKHYRHYVGYNQYVILIFNLLIADLQQSIAFSISFHWLKIGKILAPTTPCFIQAWFLQIGDVASGFFVLAIGVHTWLGVIKGYKLPYMWFVLSILFIWFFALILTVLGPAIYHERYFARAGGWCWVSDEFQPERLWLHYLWIFIVEFGTIIIYAHIFVHLRGRIRSIVANDNANKLTRATKFMIMYPAVYVVLTLPIAVGRMIAMTGTRMPDAFFCIAGCLLTSCGWIDALVYALTRHVLTNQDPSNGNGQYNQHTHNTVTAVATNAARPGDDDNHYGLQSMHSKEPNAAARTITIVGGSKRLSRIVEHRRARSHNPRSQAENTVHEDSPTRAGSQDSIFKPVSHNNGINIVTETNIEVETTEFDFDLGRPKPKDWST